MESNKIYNMDCLDGMAAIESETVDMILCDLPYGITDCKWDTVIPYDKLWGQYERIIKPNGAILLTAAQPFTTRLIHSNLRLFRYCWYWLKNKTTGFPFAKIQPLRCIEEICVFYRHTPIYNPQGLKALENPITRCKPEQYDAVYHTDTLNKKHTSYYTNYPRQVLQFACERGLHPTQKPVKLFEYLIRTYTNPGDLVLDNCIGSGTTAVACINTKRNFIGFETDQQYYTTAVTRIKTISEEETS